MSCEEFCSVAQTSSDWHNHHNLMQNRVYINLYATFIRQNGGVAARRNCSIRSLTGGVSLYKGGRVPVGHFHDRP